MARLWETGALGWSTPQILQETLYFFLTMGFGSRGSHEGGQMLWGDVDMKKEHDGTRYLEFTERATKTRTGSLGCAPRSFAPKIYETRDERCPVNFYTMFARRRPEEANFDQSPFYLTVRQGATIKDDIGYTKGPMGINPQNDIVKNVCTRGGLTGKKTNHSLQEDKSSITDGEQCAPRSRGTIEWSQEHCFTEQLYISHEDTTTSNVRHYNGKKEEIRSTHLCVGGRMSHSS